MTISLRNSLRLRWNLQVQSLIFLSWVFLSTEKAYSSFPRLKNLELILFINTLLLHGLNPRPSLYNISAKNHLNCLQNLLFESLFLWVFVAILGCGNIFDQRLLFNQKQLCIWPLELSEHYEPGNHSKNQRLKPLRNSLNVSRAKFDVRDFWTWAITANSELDITRNLHFICMESTPTLAKTLYMHKRDTYHPTTLRVTPCCQEFRATAMCAEGEKEAGKRKKLSWW